MRILAIDTATEGCSVALLDNGNCFTYFEKSLQKHTQRILPLVRKVLDKGNVRLTDLDALAFSRGPGSFTGVRISIGITQGLALGANLPMIGVSTLATMAQGAFRQIGATCVLAAMDARMEEVYWAKYTRDEQGVWHGEKTEAVCKPEIVNAELKMLSGKWAIVGTGWKAWPEMAKSNGPILIDGITPLPMAQDMLPLACQLLASEKIVSVECAEPVYLRDEMAWKKLPGKK